MHRQRIESGGLVVFLVLITLGLAAVLFSFAGALLWASLAALMFQPLFHRLVGYLPGRRTLAAGATLLIITVVIVIPTLIVASLVVGQATEVYTRIRKGELNFAAYFQQIHDAFPLRVQQLIDNSGLDTLDRVQTRIADAMSNSVSMIAGHALSIGANAAAFLLAFGVGLYAAFFLLRDGDRIGPAFVRALPLEPEVAGRIADKFVAVVRATIKGSVVVALVQGALGATTFWVVGMPAALLWGMLMAVAGLLPAIGPAIIWAPVALYLLVTGAVWQAIVVVLAGVLLIGLADNILRPILVGRDTGIPDWLVLVTTLGGINLMGLSGIVVGPVMGALFITGWSILAEKRRALGAGADAGATNDGKGSR
jgi:predicted PurR-regulated permease PerM